MPTKLETIYGAIETILETQLSDYKRFPNPYAIDANTFLHQHRGYGIAIGPGSNTERYIGCLVTWERSFTIVLVRQVLQTQNDLDNRILLEQDIIADLDLVFKAFEADSSLGGNAIKAVVSDDSGISFIDGDRLKFLAVEINLNVEYQDTKDGV